MESRRGVSGRSRPDTGGWFSADNGTNVTSADVHTPAGGWVNHPTASPAMQRLQGYLRPALLPLPTTHPLYGPLGLAPNGQLQTYVDQGAFEAFRPLSTPPTSSQRILICIQCWSTTGFPLDNGNNGLSWYQIYPGFFSPDGLERVWLSH